MATILVVEDDCHQAALYLEELTDEGYTVQCATSGAAALKMVQDIKPDLVVLDINMPTMDGLQVMAQLLEMRPSLPVIINTAYGGYRDHFLSWAATAYVCKSSDLTELKQRVREALAALPC